MSKHKPENDELADQFAEDVAETVERHPELKDADRRSRLDEVLDDMNRISDEDANHAP